MTKGYCAQRNAGPAFQEGAMAYGKGLSIEDALARSYYANHAPMIAGGYHVAEGYADAARDAGETPRQCARYACVGMEYRR